MRRITLSRGAIAALFLLMVWGCGRFASSDRNTATGNQQKPAPSEPASSGPASNTAQPAGGDPRGDLIEALRNRNNSTSYRMEGTESQSDGKSSTIVAEFQPPDRVHIIRNAEAGAAGGSKGETIGIGSDTWIRSADGAWKKSPVHIDLAGTLFGSDNLEELAKDTSTKVTYVGKESLNGTEMNVYEYSGERKDEDSGSAVKVSGKYWVGAADKRPHKIEGEADRDQDGKTVTRKVSATFDYDAPVKIESPQ